MDRQPDGSIVLKQGDEIIAARGGLWQAYEAGGSIPAHRLLMDRRFSLPKPEDTEPVVLSLSETKVLFDALGWVIDNAGEDGPIKKRANQLGQVWGSYKAGKKLSEDSIEQKEQIETEQTRAWKYAQVNIQNSEELVAEFTKLTENQRATLNSVS